MENIYSTKQVEQVLETEFKTFTDKWHGVMNQSDLQTLAKYIEQVKGKLNEIQTVKC